MSYTSSWARYVYDYNLLLRLKLMFTIPFIYPLVNKSCWADFFCIQG